MKFGWFEVGDDGEYSSFGLVKISKISAMQEAFFLWNPLD